MYKLKANGERVNALLKSGNDFVNTVLSVSAAEQFMSEGKRLKSDRKGFPICLEIESKMRNGKTVKDIWYLEGVEVKK